VKAALELHFTKGAGKYDALRIAREGLADETIPCPRQGIIPHDMIHYAVESVVPHRGFLSLLKDGQAVGFAMEADGAAQAVERLVEAFQAEMWGGRVPAEELLAVYVHACGDEAAPDVSVAEVEAIRAAIDALGEEWARVPVGGGMTVRF
jgi:hypothetical protein